MCVSVCVMLSTLLSKRTSKHYIFSGFPISSEPMEAAIFSFSHSPFHHAFALGLSSGYGVEEPLLLYLFFISLHSHFVLFGYFVFINK